MAENHKDGYLNRGNSMETEIDKILTTCPRTYREISGMMEIPIDLVNSFLASSRRRGKYGRIRLTKSQRYGEPPRSAVRAIFPFHASETLVYLKSGQDFLSRYLSEILSTRMNRVEKSLATNLLRGQISRKQIEEMWRYYEQSKGEEIEEMGVLLPQ